MTQDAKDKFYKDLLVDMYQRLRRYVYNGCGDWEFAEDVVQETFLEAYRKLDVVIEHPKPIGWLHETAKRKMMKMGKKKNALYPVEDKYLIEKVEEKTYKDIELAETVKSVVADEEYRMICDYFVNGFTSAEVAAKYGISEKAIRMKMNRLKKKLREKLSGTFFVMALFIIGGLYGL